ncbi:MAG: hypothetical protein FWE07_01190 [Turicibacter sp.]|nr:hypothetical protein [Turicibacter sp.]
MSPKELMYVEDALAHIKFMKQKCDQATTEVTDAGLKKLIDKVGKKNQKMFDNIYGLVAQSTAKPAVKPAVKKTAVKPRGGK